MKKMRFFVAIGLVLTVASGVWLVSANASAQETDPEAEQVEESAGTVVVDGLNGPQGVLAANDGSVWVIDSGLGGEEEVPAIDPNTFEVITATFGSTARVIRVTPDGQAQTVTTMPSIFVGSDITGGARLAILNGEMYATNGIWDGLASDEALPDTAAVLRVLQGEVLETAPLWELEKEDNPDGFVLQSHPYGMTAGPDGFLYVADAGANTLVRVDVAEKSAEVVVVFDGVPGPLPNPNRGDALESDPVPTGLTFGPDGTLYVSFLPGFPFLPGAAKIVTVDVDTGDVEDFATGLTMLTDLRTGPDEALYAVQLGIFTDEGPTPNSGAVLRIGPDGSAQEIISNLPFPTSVDFNADGDAYVTINGVGAPGSGAVVRFDGVATEDAVAIRFLAPEPAEEPTGQEPAADSTPEATPTAEESPSDDPEFVTGCDSLPGYDTLTEALAAIVEAGGSAGLANHMWATLVDRDGLVCAVTFSGSNRGEQWPGSRVISAQKANTANAFSLPGLALSTANLYAAVQPGGSLYGLQHSNPVDPEVAYAGPADAFGREDDPLVGRRLGGVNVFGGGLPLYDADGALLGALGVSGDTSCTDHIIAWKLRDALALDFVPAGVSETGDDNIVYDIQEDGSSVSGFGHPLCGFGEEEPAAALVTDFPIGANEEEAE